jgi:replicative DNA helicase
MPTTYKLEPATEAACILRMVADPSVLARVHRHLKPEGFEALEAKVLASAAVAYYKEWGRAPTATALMQELRERVNAGRLTVEQLRSAAHYLEGARGFAHVESEYAINLLLERERGEALWLGLEEGARLHAAGKVDDIVKVIARANAIGKVDREKGVDFRSNLSTRTQTRLETKNVRKWGTGIPDLDDIINGGPDLENPLGCVESAPKNGKSLTLAHIALHIAALGGNAVYFSMENGLGEALLRMDAAVAGVPMNDVKARATEVEAAVSDWFSNCRGRLHVVEMPQKTTTVNDLEAYLDILAVEEDFHPHCVITDYPKEMTCADPDSFEREDQRVAEVYRELRAMHRRRGHIGWTAAQLSAGGMEKKMATRGSTGGALAIEQLVDIMVAIGRTQEEEQSGLVRFGVTASRVCGSGLSTVAQSSAYEMGRVVAAFIPKP